MATTLNLDEFLRQAAGNGPCVGVHPETPSQLVPPTGVEVRTVDGARTKTLNEFFDAFAEVWEFPPWFGRNKDAFNDFMRDLDNMVNPAIGTSPPPGYLTVVTDAHLLLVDEPEAFSWFAKRVPLYRDYYRDEANPPAAFGVLLCAPPGQLQQVLERWSAAGMQVATVAV